MNNPLNAELIREIQHQLGPVLAAAQTSANICYSIEAVPENAKSLQKLITYRLRILIGSLDVIATGEVNSGAQLKQHLGREFDESCPRC